MKYKSRTKKNGSRIICPIHMKSQYADRGQPMVDLGRNGKCVGAGCLKCYEDLPVKELQYDNT